MRVESFLLIFSQCGAALSVDRLLSLWQRKPPALGPVEQSKPWCLRLLQVQIALCYWAAFSSKICGTMWIDGTAVYYITHIVEENKYALPYLYSYLWTCKLLSWITLVIEFALAVLIWFKELRLPIILIGIFFHIMLDYTLIIPQFQTIMIISLVSFIEPQTFSKMMGWIRKCASVLVGQQLVAVYDGSLDLSCRLAETVRRLDLLQLVKLVDVRQAPAHMLSNDPAAILGSAGLFIIEPSKKEFTSGLDAFIPIARRLPLVSIFYPLLYLPGLSLLVSSGASLLGRLYPGTASKSPESAA